MMSMRCRGRSSRILIDHFSTSFCLCTFFGLPEYSNFRKTVNSPCEVVLARSKLYDSRSGQGLICHLFRYCIIMVARQSERSRPGPDSLGAERRVYRSAHSTEEGSA